MIRFLCTALLLFGFSISAYAQTHFFQALPNIPVAGGLVDLPDQATVFDKAQGRIITVTALLDHTISQDDILSYYKSALPAFGWTQQTDKRYVREQETLEIRFETYQGEAYFYLTIQP